MSDYKDKKYTFLLDVPLQEETAAEGFVYVCYEDHKAELRCPCGCGDLITLNIYPYLKPTWKVTRNSITPSINRKVGCKSHFTITNGITH